MIVEPIIDHERFFKSKKEWNTLLAQSDQKIPFLTHQWFDAWWQSFSQGVDLNILFFRDDSGGLIGIAPLMKKNGKLRFIASHEVTDYCDFICRVDKKDVFYKCLWIYVETHALDYDSVELINIPSSSPTLAWLPGLNGGSDWECEIQESEVAPVLPLPGSYDEFLHMLGRKRRHELRRKRRKLGSLDNVGIERIADPEKLGTVLEEFIALHEASDPEKKEFWQKKGMREFFHALAQFFASEGWLEIRMAYVDDRPIAGQVNFLYEHTLYFYNIAFDKEYSAFSPGFALFDRSIGQAITQGIKIVDFLRGREKYKYFFGAKDSKIYSLKLLRKK